jgi:hypothetical protein
MLRTASLHRRRERNGEPQREPCLSCTVHLSAPGKGLQSFPRTSIRNGFTRPARDFNVSSPLYTKRTSREEFLTENLCDLPFFLRGPVHSECPSSSSGGRVCNASFGAIAMYVRWLEMSGSPGPEVPKYERSTFCVCKFFVSD